MLFQCWEGVMQAHVILFGRRVLTFDTMECLLVSQVNEKSHHSQEDDRNIQIPAQTRNLLIERVVQICTDYDVVLLQF